MNKLLLALLCLVALPAAALDGKEILRKVDRNLEPETYEAYRKLVDIQPDGSRKEYVLYTLKKGARCRVRARARASAHEHRCRTARCSSEHG